MLLDIKRFLLERGSRGLKRKLGMRVGSFFRRSKGH